MPLLGYFDRIYVINLKRREDRWSQISNELQRLEELHRVRRIEAVDLPGAAGCFESHLRTLRVAIEEGARTPLILEDDALFQSKDVGSLTRAIEQLPAKWDVFYLGYSLEPSSAEAKAARFYSDSVVEFPKGCFTTHAYSVHGDALQGVLWDLAQLGSRDAAAGETAGLQIDQAFLSLSSRYAMYGVYPMVATQRDGFSDIWLEQRRYRLRENIDNILGRPGRVS